MQIIAQDMLTAQGVDLTSEQRAELVERTDRMRRIITAETGYVCTDRQRLNIPVNTPDGAYIGYLTFWL